MASANQQGWMVAGASVATVAAIQLFTTADPIGRCLRFYRQLAAQVSKRHAQHSHSLVPLLHLTILLSKYDMAGKET